MAMLSLTKFIQEYTRAVYCTVCICAKSFIVFLDKSEVEPVASRDICEDELGTFLSPPAALILRQDVKTISQIYIIMFEK